MNKFLNIWLFASFISMSLALFMLKGVSEGKQLQSVMKQGHLVRVEVIRGSKSFDRSKSRFLFFRYQGREHSIRVGSDLFEEGMKNGNIKLINFSKYPDTFLLPDYDATQQVFSANIMIFVFFASAIYLAFLWYKDFKG